MCVFVGVCVGAIEHSNEIVIIPYFWLEILQKVPVPQLLLFCLFWVFRCSVSFPPFDHLLPTAAPSRRELVNYLGIAAAADACKLRLHRSYHRSVLYLSLAIDLRISTTYAKYHN